MSTHDSGQMHGSSLGEAAALGGAHPSAAPNTHVRAAGRTFVLVHGAWHGGWCWRKLTQILRQAGHTVYAPSLTGQGEHSHLLTRDVNLSTHIQDVVGLIEFEDLRDVILVGHSYAGMVITGVADKVADRIARLVYLDAFVPEPGQTMIEQLPPEFQTGWRAAAKEKGQGWQVPPQVEAKMMGITDPADAAWVDQRLRNMPLAAFEQPLEFNAERVAKIARNFIWCTGFFGLAPTAQRVRGLGWDVQDLECGHAAMVAVPEELARMILSRVD